MERNYSGYCKLIAVLAPLFILPFALAEEGIQIGEDYYGNDINAAVLEAEQNTRKLDYSHTYWYNRSTSESFNLPSMEFGDLEETNLEGALGSTAAGGDVNINTKNIAGNERITTIEQDNKNSELLQSTQPAIVQLKDTDVTPEPFNLILERSVHHFPNGDTVTTEGVYSGSVLISTPRP